MYIYFVLSHTHTDTTLLWLAIPGVKFRDLLCCRRYRDAAVCGDEPAGVRLHQLHLLWLQRAHFVSTRLLLFSDPTPPRLLMHFFPQPVFWRRETPSPPTPPPTFSPLLGLAIFPFSYLSSFLSHVQNCLGVTAIFFLSFFFNRNTCHSQYEHKPGRRKRIVIVKLSKLVAECALVKGSVGPCSRRYSRRERSAWPASKYITASTLNCSWWWNVVGADVSWHSMWWCNGAVCMSAPDASRGADGAGVGAEVGVAWRLLLETLPNISPPPAWKCGASCRGGARRSTRRGG